MHNVIKESVRRVLKESLDQEAALFKQSFLQMLQSGNYDVDLYDSDYDDYSHCFDSSWDFWNSELSAHVYLLYKVARNGNIRVTEMSVVPRIGEGDPLGNGERYEFRITDSTILNAVANQIIDYIPEDDY